MPKNMSEHFETLSQGKQDERDNLLVAGAGTLAFSLAYSQGFKKGVICYLQENPIHPPTYTAERLTAKYMINWGRASGLAYALPSALLFSGAAKLYTMIKNCPKRNAEQIPVTSTNSTRPSNKNH